ncbi:transglutaminase-like domain-containing protein [Arthrobacter castelli]|uniref:transglutaminase-like domain-containing protein n=1 Tax=Arthrobacter castelli TaxID=271431 RepID=UPI00040BF22A|nr:transglutaminase-like domain-containing protein [Arthrobacter castelli]
MSVGTEGRGAASGDSRSTDSRGDSRSDSRGAAGRPRGGKAPQRTPLQYSIDAVVLLVLLGICVAGFGPSFGGDLRYLVAGFGGILLGLGTAWFGARYRLQLLVMLALTLVVYLLTGSALATPVQAWLGVFPTFDSLTSLLLGIVFAWKQLLTIAAPVGTDNGMLIVPFLSSLVTAVIASSLAWRTRHPVWAVIPVVTLFVLGIAFGTDDAVMPLLRGVLLTVISVVWLSYRWDQARTDDTTAVSANQPDADAAAARSGRVRRLGAGAAVLAVASTVTIAVVPVFSSGGERQVLRDVVVPPLELYDYPSPLMSFRYYVQDQAEETLFTVKGLPEGARIRLAAMNAYNGVVYNVNPAGAGNFAPVGDAKTLGGADRGLQNGKGAAQLQVTIKDYRGVWVPSSGSMNGINLTGDRQREIGQSLFYNNGSGTLLTTSGIRPGSTYGLSVTYPDQYTDDQLAQYDFANLSLPKPTNVPPIVGVKANELVGEATTPIEQARNIEAALKEQGFFSNGKENETPSLSGHGAARITALLDAEQMVGDDEQYAVAMALMARHLGMPARVVMGFYPPEDEAGAKTIAIQGEDVHAWVEIAFEHVGWVPFNPTPDEDNVPIPPEPQPKSTPKPQVLQPPPPPQEPAELPPDSAPDPLDAQEEEKTFWDIWGPLIIAIVAVIIPVLILLLPLLLIALLKLRRRKRRAWLGLPAQRVHGGWSEILSLATDLGATINPKSTRRETAANLGESFEGSRASTSALAHHADAAIFGAGEPTEEQVSRYWDHVRTSLDDMHGSVGFWKRQRAKYSPRSLFHDARTAMARRRSGGRKSR